MLAFHCILFLRQQQVGKVNACAQGCTHLVRHVSTVHSGEAVLRLPLTELLQLGNVLQENQSGLHAQEVNILDSDRQVLVVVHPENVDHTAIVSSLSDNP